MPLVKSDIPNMLEAGLKAVFFEEYDRASADWERIATVVPSVTDTEDYAWLGSVPAMREFKDERLPAGLLEHGYSIKNKTWEASIAVERAALEDERYGQIKLRVQGLGREARRHQDELVFTLLRCGFSTPCYDGQFFFDTDHVSGEGGSQANKGTSPLSASALQTAISAMMKYEDERGKPMGVIPDLLVVPPDLQWTAMELLNSTYYPELVSQTGGTGGTQKLAANVLKGKLDLVVSPYLTDSTDWFLMCTRGPVKPLLFQSRLPVEFAALESNSENGFMRDEYLYGVRARYNVGFGLWQMVYGSQVSG